MKRAKIQFQEIVSEENRDTDPSIIEMVYHWRLSSDPKNDFKTEANRTQTIENAIKNADFSKQISH